MNDPFAIPMPAPIPGICYVAKNSTIAAFTEVEMSIPSPLAKGRRHPDFSVSPVTEAVSAPPVTACGRFPAAIVTSPNAAYR